MAYKTVINKAIVNRATAMAEIHTQLLAMGWSYVDGMCDEYDIPYTDVEVTNNTFTKVGHTYTDSQPVAIKTSGTIPAGLAINTKYFVVGVSGDTFQLSATYNGAAINITSQGTGTHTIYQYSRTYKSNGENSDQPYHYIGIYEGYATSDINFRTAYSYNLTTRTMVAMSYGAYGIVTINQTGFYLWIHGDKDMVFIHTKVVSTYYRAMFGFMKPFLPLKTSLTQAASLGSSVVLNVSDSTGFEVGYSYMIVGMAAEGRDTVTVTAVGTGTITVSSLLRNYGIGSLIGLNPVCFGHNAASVFYTVNGLGVVGLEDAGSVYGGFNSILFELASSDPDMFSNKYILQPISITQVYNNLQSLQGICGYVDTHFLLAPTTGMVIEDTFAVGRLDSGTSSGSNSTSVLNDSTKSWTVNAFANKVVVIIFGAGAGMIKKIASNTATAITLDASNTFDTIPDATSQYIICEEGYRYMSTGTGTGVAPYTALQEGV